MTYFIEQLRSMRPFFEVVNVIASFLAILTWLIAVPFLIIAWRKSNKIILSVFGIQATLHQRVEAAAAIGAATGQRSMQSEKNQTMLRPEAIAQTIDEAMNSLHGTKLSEKHILWVDDRPAGIGYEARALTALGPNITFALDTQPAVDKLSAQEFDLVISDMGRPSSDRAGYALLETVRPRLPFIIYSGSNAPEHRQEALDRGAIGATNDPQELLEMVVKTLLDARSRVGRR